MKKVLKSALPPLLAAHVAAQPNDTWEAFCDNCRSGKTEVQQQLIADQRGLCAYCEINMTDGPKHQELRVEHFYPNKPHRNAPHNKALDWQNLLGVCFGGNTRVHWDSVRFTSPDYSCDVPKGDKDLSSMIQNPLTMPLALLFVYDTSDANHVWIQVDKQHQDVWLELDGDGATSLEAKAQHTIDELRLNAGRLGRFRRGAFDGLQQAFLAEVQAGSSDTEAIERLAQAFFLPGPEPWPAFFSMIRWFLGPAAEQRLQELAYSG